MRKRKPLRFFLLVFGLASLAGTLALYALLHWPPTVAWLASANVAAFVLWGFDKRQARRRGRRVPEMALHGMAVLGATPAALVAMRVFRHKTLKVHFVALYSFLFVIQAALAFRVSGG